MRAVILGAALTAILAGAAPVHAQSNPFRPVVYVDSSVVTQFDIDQRMRFLGLLHAPDTSRGAAEKALVDDRLRMIAGSQMGMTPTEDSITAAMTEFAGRGGLTLEQFGQLLSQNGIEAESFRDFVTSGLVWREVVRQRVVPSVTVSEAEVDQEFVRIAETPKVTAVLLSELIIPAPPGQEEQAHRLAEEIAANVRSEGDFAAAARQYSATPSAQEGGRLKWTPLANLPPSLRPIILGIEKGHVSPPLTVEGASILFFLRDTRGTVRPGAREQVLDYLRLRLGDPAQAAQIATGVRDCADLYLKARGLPADRLIEQKDAPQGAIPGDIALRLASLDADEATVMGGDVVMLCRRAPALLEAAPTPAVPLTDTPPTGEAADAPLPDRDAVRDIVFNRKVQVAADAYLAEFRAKAILRRP